MKDENLYENNKEVFINMGIDYLFYPEKVAAQEVITLLGHSSTTEYVDFSGGKLSLVVFRLDVSSPLIGRTLIEITRDRENLEYRTVAISRGGRTIIPRGEDTFEAPNPRCTCMVLVTSDKPAQLDQYTFWFSMPFIGTPLIITATFSLSKPRMRVRASP